MNRFLPLFALLLVFGLVACAEDTATTEPVDEPAPAVEEPAPADTMAADADAAPAEVTLDGTIAAVPEGGITAIPAGAALDNINGWIAQLDGAEFTNAAEIRQGLMDLSDQLQTDPLDGAAIGATLTDLGTWTAESAPDNEQIQTLAGALSAGGAALTGGE
ncbi:MAG: hypothetical protein AAGI52_07475 [Bacteroidota bacterium]